MYIVTIQITLHSANPMEGRFVITEHGFNIERRKFSTMSQYKQTDPYYPLENPNDQTRGCSCNIIPWLRGCSGLLGLRIRMSQCMLVDHKGRLCWIFLVMYICFLYCTLNLWKYIYHWHKNTQLELFLTRQYLEKPKIDQKLGLFRWCHQRWPVERSTMQKQQSSVADWYSPWVCSCSAWLTHKYTNVPCLFPGQYI